MIDPDTELRIVTHIHADYEDEDSDCIDISPGELIMALRKHADTDYMTGKAVMISAGARKQFERMSWNVEWALSVYEKHTQPISEDEDARLRAIVALTDRMPIDVA